MLLETPLRGYPMSPHRPDCVSYYLLVGIILTGLGLEDDTPDALANSLGHLAHSPLLPPGMRLCYDAGDSVIPALPEFLSQLRSVFALLWAGNTYRRRGLQA